MKEKAKELDYDLLIRDYDQGLHEKLRNFSTGFDFLETWVPDENHSRSLLGIFEAAEISGLRDDLAIRVSPEIAKKIDQKWLEQETDSFGDLRVESGRFVFKFNQKKQTQDSRLKLSSRVGTLDGVEYKTLTPNLPNFGSHDSKRKLESVHPAYLNNIKEAAGGIVREGNFGDLVDAKVIKSKDDRLQLAVQLNKKSVIKQARHQGGSELERPLLDQFCLVIEGLSLQEASDHGVLRLEHSLRDPNVDLGIPGIVTPENTDPMFKVPQQLVRDLFQAQLSETGTKAGRNFWTDKVQIAWLNTSNEEKIARLQGEIDRFLENGGAKAGGIRVQEIVADTRVIVQILEKALSAELLSLERYLRAEVEAQIEVLLSEKKDTNKPREQTT